MELSLATKLGLASISQAPELIPIIRDISDPEQNYYVIKSNDASPPTAYIQVRMDKVNVMHPHNP